MPYPKPLSEKSLKKLYAQSGISPEVRDYLHTMFAACANLYGAVTLREVWAVYQEIKYKPLRIHKRDVIAFSSIVRRESLPYRVYEIEELYVDEPHSEFDRFIVSNSLIGIGYGKLIWFYNLMEVRGSRSLYVPDDFLTFAESTVTPEEQALFDYIGDLRSTEKDCVPPYGDRYPNVNCGKKLSEFSFLNKEENFNVEWYEKNSSRHEALLRKYGGTEAEKIIRQYTLWENIGDMDPTDVLSCVAEELTEAGVALTTVRFRRLTDLMMNAHNNSHLWCIGGWTPCELSARTPRTGMPEISFGPGLQKALADGSISKDDIFKTLSEMGFKVLPPKR